jgi:hypothetical protein
MWPKMLAKTVEPTERGFRLYLTHPQWGGYSVPATSYDRDEASGPGCFELSCYHDGDFPADTVQFEWHCCSAEQFIRFGLDVLEAQLDHQVDEQGKPIQLDCREQMEGFIERIQKLLQR